MSDEAGWWDNADEAEEADEAGQENGKEEIETPEPAKNEEKQDKKTREPKMSESRDDHEEKAKTRKAPPITDAAPAAEKNEALLIIEAKQKKREEEEMEELRALEDQRRIQREKEDEELRKLKEKQERRRKEREEEERKMEEMKQLAAEQRQKEEEQRRLRTEEDKRKKALEIERKKAAAQAAMSGGRNFVIDREKNAGDGTMDKFMNISKAKNEMSLNTGELEALKRRTVSERVRPLSISDVDQPGLKTKAEELWKTIIQLETANYDLGERFKRQEYDLKELNERQRQINHKKHVAQGLDSEVANTRYPPKVQLISKYERRTDRRTFTERKTLFEQDKKIEEPKERVEVAAKTRDSWIKAKEAENRRARSYDDADEEKKESRETVVPPRKLSERVQEEEPEVPEENNEEEEPEEPEENNEEKEPGEPEESIAEEELNQPQEVAVAESDA